KAIIADLKFVAIDAKGRPVDPDICNLSPIATKGDGVYTATITGRQNAQLKIVPYYKDVPIGNLSRDLIVDLVDHKIDLSKSPINLNPKSIKVNKDRATLTFKAVNKGGQAISGLKNLT